MPDKAENTVDLSQFSARTIRFQGSPFRIKKPSSDGLLSGWSRQQESNLHYTLRRHGYYPLYYGETSSLGERVFYLKPVNNTSAGSVFFPDTLYNIFFHPLSTVHYGHHHTLGRTACFWALSNAGPCRILDGSRRENRAHRPQWHGQIITAAGARWTNGTG